MPVPFANVESSVVDVNHVEKEESEMNESIKSKPSVRGPTSIGHAAARRRDQLDKFEEAEQRRQQAYRQERERLARELAELEVQERRIQRQQHLKEKQRACYLLGELVLNRLKSQGITDLSVSRSDLNSLKPEALALIATVVGRGQVAPAAVLDEPLEAVGRSRLVPDVSL